MLNAEQIAALVAQAKGSIDVEAGWRVLYFLGFQTLSGWSGVQGFLSNHIFNVQSVECLRSDELFGPLPLLPSGDPIGGRVVAIGVKLCPDYNAFALVPVFENLAQMFYGEYLGSCRPDAMEWHTHQEADWVAVLEGRKTAYERGLAELKTWNFYEHLRGANNRVLEVTDQC